MSERYGDLDALARVRAVLNYHAGRRFCLAFSMRGDTAFVHVWGRSGVSRDIVRVERREGRWVAVGIIGIFIR